MVLDGGRSSESLPPPPRRCTLIGHDPNVLGVKGLVVEEGKVISVPSAKPQSTPKSKTEVVND